MVPAAGNGSVEAAAPHAAPNDECSASAQLQALCATRERALKAEQAQRGFYERLVREARGLLGEAYAALLLEDYDVAQARLPSVAAKLRLACCQQTGSIVSLGASSWARPRTRPCSCQSQPRVAHKWRGTCSPEAFCSAGTVPRLHVLAEHSLCRRHAAKLLHTCTFAAGFDEHTARLCRTERDRRVPSGRPRTLSRCCGRRRSTT